VVCTDWLVQTRRLEEDGPAVPSQRSEERGSPRRVWDRDVSEYDSNPYLVCPSNSVFSFALFFEAIVKLDSIPFYGFILFFRVCI
jgi:hypothetical protein